MLAWAGIAVTILISGCAVRSVSDHWYVVRIEGLPEAGGEQLELHRREGLRSWLVDESVWAVTPYPGDCVTYGSYRGALGNHFYAVCGRRQPFRLASGPDWVSVPEGLIQWKGFSVSGGQVYRNGKLISLESISRIAAVQPELRSGWFKRTPDVTPKIELAQFSREVKGNSIDESSGDPMIVVAADIGAEDAALAFLGEGVNPNMTDAAGTSLMFIACRKGEVRLVRALLDRRVTARGQRSGGISALGIAAAFRREGVLRLLLSRERFDTKEIQEALADRSVQNWPVGSELLRSQLR